MAITVGDKEVYKIIQNGKLQRVVNKGDKQLFRGDQLKPVLVEKIDMNNLLDSIVMIDDNNFIGQDNNRNVYVIKKIENRLIITNKIESDDTSSYSRKNYNLAITDRNDIVYYFDGNVWLFDRDYNFLFKKRLREVRASNHTKKNFVTLVTPYTKPQRIDVYDLDYNLIKTEFNVWAMAIFDNTIVKLKKDGFYVEANGQESKVFNETEPITNSFLNFTTNDNYLFVRLGLSNRPDEISYLIDKNGNLKYRKKISSDITFADCYLNDYNAVSVFNISNNPDLSYSLDFEGNIVYYNEKSEFLHSYTTDKQMFAIKNNRYDKYVSIYKNRHLK